MQYNKENYVRVFSDKPVEWDQIVASETEPSLSICVQKWLERTPGLDENGFNFPAKFKAAVQSIFDEEMGIIEVRAALHLATEMISAKDLLLTFLEKTSSLWVLHFIYTLSDLFCNSQKETNETRKAYLMANFRKKKEQFDSIFEPDLHEALDIE